MGPSVDFRILGPLEVWHDGSQVHLAGARQRALLAVLLLHVGEVVSADRLLDDLWGEGGPGAGAAALRVRVSQLRRALGPVGEAIMTRPHGYVLEADPDALDLRRFERLVSEGDRLLGSGDAAGAARALEDALALWRGAPLADFPDAPFAQAAVVRLEDLRLAAVELRADAELQLGRHARLAGDLQALVREHPLRERLVAQLMLALYRDGRQAEALAAYRAARARLVEELGLEPGPALQELERRILAHDPALGPDARPEPPAASHGRAIVVVAGDDATTPTLTALGEALSAGNDGEVIVAALTGGPEALAAAATRLEGLRLQRGTRVRVTAFTTSDRGADAVRLAAEQDAALLVLDAPGPLLASGAPDPYITVVLAHAPCDVALVAGADRVAPGDWRCDAVLVPFSGRDHDWAAVELGAWLARASGAPLRLLGAHGDERTGRRDASRLLANASLALQRGLAIAAEPTLIEPGVAGVTGAARAGAVIVLGLSDRWAREGVGAARSAIARAAPVPVVMVRRGLRPSGLAPGRALTHFTWSAG